MFPKLKPKFFKVPRGRKIMFVTVSITFYMMNNKGTIINFFLLVISLTKEKVLS